MTSHKAKALDLVSTFVSGLYYFRQMRNNDKYIGKRFSRLFIQKINYVQKFNNGRRDGYVGIAECVCDCGRKTHPRLFNILRGSTKSCGCLNDETRGKPTIKHRHASHKNGRTPEYIAWKNLKARCYDEKTKSFVNYGGRGITVWDGWKNDFVNFFNYMGKRPSPSHSIERINNDGNYEPGNCRWATRTDQNRNKRTSIVLNYLDSRLSMMELSEKLNISYRALYYHYRKGDILKYIGL